jgi:DEAD/DEAH box helicase
MFDPVTAAFLQRAPALPDLNPATLPQTLTARYAELVARRLRQVGGDEVAGQQEEGEWPLTRIADAYELVASVHDDADVRRAAAFVAGTAQQILAQETVGADEGPARSIVDRDHVNPALAASILFLAAEQYADANESAQRIHIEEGRQDYVATLLAEDIRDLAAGRLDSILQRASRRPEHFIARGGLEARGTVALFETLLVGIELFAAEVLGEEPPANAAGRFETANAAFSRVLDLSSNAYQSRDQAVGTLLTTYPGPRHLAALLLSAYDAAAPASVTKIGPPPGVGETFWRKWLRHRAAAAPFMWPNHRDAVAKGFHIPGTSAVMVLPTGAGKTTISCLKIAGVLATGRSVIFIAPTHALVDQLTVDLQEIFPEELLGSLVSSDFDRLFATGTTLRKIEVMTPERCLALLSYAPTAFADVGLMVFDECHLLSPLSGLRRALDGMFCVLAFNSIVSDADFLFLSAMIRNGHEFANWIEALTGRHCVFVDPLWKPSRQARGVVFYEKNRIAAIRRAALETQRQKDAAEGRAVGLRIAAKAKLIAEPFALFGLRHNWLNKVKKRADCTITGISGSSVELSGELRNYQVVIRPNVNAVAAHIATASVRSGLKTIVFVNVKSHAIKVAETIAENLGTVPRETPDETERWRALEAELGGTQTFAPDRSRRRSSSQFANAPT